MGLGVPLSRDLRIPPRSALQNVCRFVGAPRGVAGILRRSRWVDGFWIDAVGAR